MTRPGRAEARALTILEGDGGRGRILGLESLWGVFWTRGLLVDPPTALAWGAADNPRPLKHVIPW